MWQKQWDFSKEFEWRLFDAVIHVLASHNAETTVERVRNVMEEEDLTDEEKQCFDAVITTFEKAEEREGFPYKVIDLDIIKEHFLSVPTLIFEDVFEKYYNIYIEKDKKERELQNIGDGYVTYYKWLANTLGEIYNMFYFILRAVRLELGEAVKDELSRPSTNDPNVIEVYGQDPNFPNMTFVSFKRIDTPSEPEEPEEEGEFEFNPRY